MEDPPKSRPARFSAEQIAYVKKVLSDNKKVRWTVVLMHKPVWIYNQVAQIGWARN